MEVLYSEKFIHLHINSPEIVEKFAHAENDHGLISASIDVF